MTSRGDLVALSEELGEYVSRVGEVAAAIDGMAGPDAPDLTHIWALAGHLHSFYTGCESVLTRAVRLFEGAPRSAPDSHVQLLRQAARDLPSLRPAVIRKATADALDPYLRFRHFFRNAYGAPLDWPRMERKVRDIRATFDRFAADVEAFRAFLTAAANA